MKIWSRLTGGEEEGERECVEMGTPYFIPNLNVFFSHWDYMRLAPRGQLFIALF